MNTSKYDSNTRYRIKRELRSQEVQGILDGIRKERRDIEAKLAERNAEIASLRKIVQGQIDSGAWSADWARLGFVKKADE